MIDPAHLDRFIAASRKAAREFGLVQCSSGNLSWRVDEQHVLVTASRSWMADLTAEQVVVCRLSDGEVLNDKRPSVETRFHLGVLRTRADVRAVLHFQSPCATAIACANPADYTFDILPEMPFYIGTPAVVPFLMPGSEELADAVVAALTNADLAILQNHGQVAAAGTMEDAIQMAVFFELVCQVLLRPVTPRPLPAEALNALRALGKDRTGPV